MQQFLQDLKQASRTLRRKPGFTATAVAALALGIGVNTAIFSVVNAVLLKPLPYSDPKTLVAVENTRHGTVDGPWTSPVRFMYWRAQTDVFSDVAAISQNPYYVNYTGSETPEQVKAAKVSESYFRVLHVRIVRGRSFTPAEDRPGGPKVAVISYDFWQRRLGGMDVLGKSLPLSGSSYTVVGITGQHFSALNPFFEGTSSTGNAELLLPFQLDPKTTNDFKSFSNLARLKPGVTLAEARARVAASAAAFRQRFPASLRKDDGFSVMQAQQAITTMYGDPHARLWVLIGAFGFVLLIACVNVANLLLVRATGLAHEIAIRSALGAARSRIVRQLLTESLLLSLMGGLLGLFVGFLGIHALLSVSTAGLPRLGPGGSLVAVDWRVVAFTLGLSIATSLVFGLAPALVGSRSDLNAVIKNTGGRLRSGFRQNKAGSMLVTVEVGLAVVLLIGAALLIRTSLALGQVDPGFNPSHVLTMRTTLSTSRFPTPRSLAPIIRNGLKQVRSLPGVESAAATCCAPLQGNLTLSFHIVGRPQDTGLSMGISRYATTSGDYFAALGIPVLRGRAFAPRDDAGAPAVAIINEAMAKRFWANGQDPLQDRIEVGRGSRAPVRRIIGIVGNVHYGGLDKAPGPTIYVPMAQAAKPIYMSLARAGVPKGWVVRTRGDSAVLTEAIKNSISKATEAPVVDVEPMERVLAHSVSHQRLNMLLMSIFGGSALLLAAIGIYGVLAYSVQRRVHEIGIRMALGAGAERVKWTVVRQGMILIAIGIAAGLVAAFYTAHVLVSWLFEVKPHDPVVFLAVPVVLALVALVSVWLPARRASRVDPVVSLRHE